ncbi:czcA family heavy metal efflux pump, partial, partial [Acetobacter tropicalis]
LRCSVWRF